MSVVQLLVTDPTNENYGKINPIYIETIDSLPKSILKEISIASGFNITGAAGNTLSYTFVWPFDPTDSLLLKIYINAKYPAAQTTVFPLVAINPYLTYSNAVLYKYPTKVATSLNPLVVATPQLLNYPIVPVSYSTTATAGRIDFGYFDHLSPSSITPIANTPPNKGQNVNFILAFNPVDATANYNISLSDGTITFSIEAISN